MYIPLEKQEIYVITDKSNTKVYRINKSIAKSVFLGKQSNTMTKAPNHLKIGVRKSFL